MTPDPKLVEAVAKAMFMSTQEPEYAETAWEFLPEDAGSHGTKRDYRDMARAALAAIPASGEWWVAPTEPSEAMVAATVRFGRTIAETAFRAMRDAHLKYTGTADVR